MKLDDFAEFPSFDKTKLERRDVCCVCGHDIAYHYVNSETLMQKQMCFDCNFWDELREQDAVSESHSVAIINGTHYRICDENAKGMRGFGGNRFDIKFNDGTTVSTTNLWCQGKPSKYWSQCFPDNATFDYQWKEINNTKYLIKNV